MPENRLYCIDYLRTTSVIFVLFIHALLPYAIFSHISTENYVFSTWPVVEANQQNNIVSLIAIFIDIFNMGLLFCIAGFFSAITIHKSGSFHFLVNRFLRLGLPFLVVVTFYTPLASYATYMLTGHSESYFYFWRHVFFSNYWHSGTSWFLWVLLAFSIGFSVNRMFKAKQLTKKRQSIPFGGRKFIILSLCLYIICLGLPNSVIHLYGPLWVQFDRTLLYFWIFSIGTFLGSMWCQMPELISKKGSLARCWWAYIGVAASLYVVLLTILCKVENFDPKIVETIRTARSMAELQPYMTTIKAILAYKVLNPLICALMVVGLFGFYCRFLNVYSKRIEYLSQHSYAITLLHFPIVVWLQYTLLEMNLPVAIKISLNFILTFLLSFILAIGLRKIPGVKRVI